MAKKSRRKKRNVWEIDVMDADGTTNNPKVMVERGDTIQWNPVGVDFVEIKFVDHSPLLFFEKHPKGRKGKPLKRNVRILLVEDGSFPYGTPGRARKRAGDPEIIVTGGKRNSQKKARKRKAGKKR